MKTVNKRAIQSGIRGVDSVNGNFLFADSDGHDRKSGNFIDVGNFGGADELRR